MVCKLKRAGECEGGGTHDHIGLASYVRLRSWFARRSDWPEDTSPGKVPPQPPELLEGPEPEEEEEDMLFVCMVLLKLCVRSGDGLDNWFRNLVGMRVEMKGVDLQVDREGHWFFLMA